MTQLSRPFQVALVAVGVLVIVWFVALRGHSGSEGSSSSASSVTSKPASSASSGSGSSGSVYHGSAPGVEGLSRAIAKAHGAVSQSQQNAKQLEQKATQASSSTGGTVARKPAASAVASPSATPVSSHSSSADGKTSASGARRATQSPAGQVWVEHQLKRHAVVALLFYNPKGSDDIRTRSELEALIAARRGGTVSVEARELSDARVVRAARHKRAARIVLRVASASKVGSYGSFTRVASIYQTPTLLLIRPGGHIEPAMTGLTDAFSIEQAIVEQARR